MKRFLIAAPLALLATPAFSASIAADTLLCESPEPFAVIAADKWTSVGATAQLKTAALSVQFYELSAKGSGIIKGLALDEEAIRADSRSRLAQGQTGARAAAAQNDEHEARSKKKTYENIIATCASSGQTLNQVEVLERKPISGIVKVRLNFKGLASELWTREDAIRAQ